VSPMNNYVTTTFRVSWSVGLYIWFYSRQIDTGSARVLPKPEPGLSVWFALDYVIQTTSNQFEWFSSAFKLGLNFKPSKKT
jgi:hypothetical protein